MIHQSTGRSTEENEQGRQGVLTLWSSAVSSKVEGC